MLYLVFIKCFRFYSYISYYSSDETGSLLPTTIYTCRKSYPTKYTYFIFYVGRMLLHSFCIRLLPTFFNCNHIIPYLRPIRFPTPRGDGS